MDKTLKWAVDILAGRVLIFDADWAKKQAKDALEYARDFYHNESEKFERVATQALDEAKAFMAKADDFVVLISVVLDSVTKLEILTSQLKLDAKVRECIDRHDKAMDAADKALNIKMFA